MRIYVLSLLLMLFCTSRAQTLIIDDNDTTIISEYLDGRLWAYRQTEDFVVGMTNYEAKDDYGKYYQIAIFIKNLSESSITFDPKEVTSSLTTKKGDTLVLQVFTYDEYMKKVKNAQAWSMALLGLSVGLNAGLSGYQSTYTYNYAAATAVNIAATTQMMTLGKLMADERSTKSQGYLKKNTIHPGEGIVGYINIKRKRGTSMTVNIPIDEHVFSFDWDVMKRRK